MKRPREKKDDDQERCERSYNDLLAFLVSYQASTGTETAQMVGPMIHLIMEADYNSGLSAKESLQQLVTAFKFYKSQLWGKDE